MEMFVEYVIFTFLVMFLVEKKIVQTELNKREYEVLRRVVERRG